MKTLSNKLLLTLSCITFSVMANDASSINSYEDQNKEANESSLFKSKIISETYNNTLVDLKEAAERFFVGDE